MASLTVFVLNTSSHNFSGEPDEEFFDIGKQIVLRSVQKMLLLNPKEKVMIILTKDEKKSGLSLLANLEIPTWDTYECVNEIEATPGCYVTWRKSLKIVHKLIEKSEQRLEMKKDKLKIIFISHLYEDDNVKKEDVDQLVEEFKMFKHTEFLYLSPKTENLEFNSTKMMKYLIKSLANAKQIIAEEYYRENLELLGGDMKKSASWKCDFELAPNIKIGIRSYLFVTKNAPLRPKKPIAIDNDSEVPKIIPLIREVKTFDNTRLEHSITDNVVMGYRYGKKYYPVPKEKEREKMDTKKSLIFMYFHTNGKDDIKWEIIGNNTHILVPEKKDRGPFCALVKKMISKKRVAIVRRVYLDGYCPSMFVLQPQAETETLPWCFFMNQLRFRDETCIFDPRPYFPDSDNKEKNEAAKALVKSFRVNSQLKPGLVPSPVLEYTWDCITHRMFNPVHDPLPKPKEKTLELFGFPKTKEYQDSLEKIIQAFQLNEIDDQTTTEEAPPMLPPPVLAAPPPVLAPSVKVNELADIETAIEVEKPHPPLGKRSSDATDLNIKSTKMKKKESSDYIILEDN